MALQSLQKGMRLEEASAGEWGMVVMNKQLWDEFEFKSSTSAEKLNYRYRPVSSTGRKSR